MGLTKEKKSAIVKDYKVHEKDTGSSFVQIALLSKRIEELTDHFKIHKSDHHSRHGLLRLVSQRRRLLNYLKKKDPAEYSSIIKKLNLRR